MTKMFSVSFNAATGEVEEREFTIEEYAQAERDAELASQVAQSGDEQNASTPDTPSDPS